MGLLDKIKSAFSLNEPGSNEYEDVITSTRKELEGKGIIYFYNIKVNNTTSYTEQVSKWEDAKKIDFIVYCIKEIHRFNNKKQNVISSSDSEYRNNNVRQEYIKQLFKSKLIIDETGLGKLKDSFVEYKLTEWQQLNTWPLASMLNQLASQNKESGLTEAMVAALSSIKAGIAEIDGRYYQKEKLKITEKIDTLIFRPQNEDDVRPVLFSGADDFAAYVNETISLLPEEEKKIWYQLIAKALKSTGSKPSAKFLEETKELFKKLGADKFKKTVNDWFVFLATLKEKITVHTQTYNNRSYNYNSVEFLSLVNIEPIKGFVWMCSHFHDTATIHTIANLAERCYRKIPGQGPAAAGIGNACVYTLYRSKGIEGIGQLSRLKVRVKQNSAQKIIEKYLEEAAKEQGISLHEIEDLAVDDYGLTAGKKEIQFDGYKAEIKITGTGKCELNWFRENGTLQKSVPAAVKEKDAAKLKKVKATVKQIELTTSVQRDRIDRMFRSDRKWSMDNFLTYYLNHGLLGFITEKIIWVFTFNDTSVSVIYINNQWITNDGETVVPNENCVVSLWHPATQSVSEIKKWREFLVSRKIQQPLKQAFREVYLLTDAELKTRTYSNRMAAHLLKQHQYVTLAKGRLWTARLMGGWDGGDQDIAQLRIPEFKITAQFWVQSVEGENDMNQTGIWNYVSTDQIRFINNQNDGVMNLVDVPPVLFSEVLRDVDLFVGVASVGNDPVWRDSGGLPAFRDYWTSYSFGDLTEVAKNRKEILASLLPRLKIKDVAEIKDKFLVVKGSLRTYKIHIGSTNILMEPNDQYLCIVPDRSQKNHTENLFIPFEGDNGLSIILSKAFLLAADTKITDSTITSQINRN